MRGPSVSKSRQTNRKTTGVRKSKPFQSKKTLSKKNSKVKESIKKETAVYEAELDTKSPSNYFLSFFTGFLIFVFSLVLLTPIGFGFYWVFRDQGTWAGDFFNPPNYHPYYYGRILEGSGAFALIYSAVVTWKVFKFIKYKTLVFEALFIGSFFFAAYILDYLLSHGYLHYSNY